MGKIFENLYLTLAIGLILAILIMLLPDSNWVPPGGDVNGILQWLHVFFGVTWIGLLYYFNFVQIPTMPNVPAELKPAVSKHIAPSALFYFRWGAAFTVLTGLLLAWSYQELVEALTLQPSARLIGIGMWLALIIAWLNHYLHEALSFKPGFQLIGIGMWLALIMAFNVWVIIWPNQKKALGVVAADDAAKAKAARTAMITSRINTLLSIPMLLCMTNAK